MHFKDFQQFLLGMLGKYSLFGLALYMYGLSYYRFGQSYSAGILYCLSNLNLLCL